jgi:large subunit ribosomal protein L15
MADADEAPEAKPRSRARSKAAAAESTAEKTVPESTGPESTGPESTAAAGTTEPESTAAEGTAPKGKAPASTASGSTASGSTAPASTAPASTAPRSKATESASNPGRARLKLHHLRPAPGARRDRTRVGRGEASKGKTAGRGTKGTRARDTVPPNFEGGQMPIHRRLPKLKGFSNSAFKTTYQVVNLDRLTALYPSGGDVTPDDLVAKGAVRKGQPVKILGTGEAGATFRVTAHAFSGSAREKIAAVGGSATVKEF